MEDLLDFLIFKQVDDIFQNSDSDTSDDEPDSKKMTVDDGKMSNID